MVAENKSTIARPMSVFSLPWNLVTKKNTPSILIYNNIPALYTDLSIPHYIHSCYLYWIYISMEWIEIFIQALGDY